MTKNSWSGDSERYGKEDMKANGCVFKYGDNVDTDVIIPARYLNSSDPAELAKHCMAEMPVPGRFLLSSDL